MSAPAVGLRIRPRGSESGTSPVVRVLASSPALRAIAFALLAAFSTAHWNALLEPAGTRRALAVALLGTAAGVAIALTARLPRPTGLALRIALVVALLALTLTAVGVPVNLLWPKRWDTLADRISAGLNAAGSVSEWPYGGPNRWLRLTTLMGGALGVTAAAALAFWPGRRGADHSRALRFCAFVLLVMLYAVAVAARPFDSDGLRGFGLLLAIGIWLWLPRMTGREAAAAASAVLVAGLAGLVLTGPVAAKDPWVDYRQWSWTLPKEKTVAFEWSHRYGPLDWPRKGTTLLLVKAKKAHYWKAENLDRFDGRRWANLRLRDNAALSSQIVRPGHRTWNETIEFTVRGLASDVLIGAGTTYAVPDGDVGAVVPLSDATHLVDRALGSGDSYKVRAYVPDPSAREMRRAPEAPRHMQRYTRIDLPGTGTATVPVNTRGVHDPAEQAVDDASRREAAAQIDASPYARVRRLAQRIGAGAATDYARVRSVIRYLERNYTYSENVPSHLYPLTAFLFEDRRGYCQQFSGAAALMLRMLGVPTRVATGFTPGTLNKDTGEYVVQDLDAHSWIEVWFEGIGWVPFDPTPALAPAQSQVAPVAPSAASGDARDRIPRQSLDRLLGQRPDSSLSAPVDEGGGFPWGPVLLGLSGAALLSTAGLVWWRTRRRGGGRPAPVACGDDDVDHLVRLMSRLGLDVGPRTTLFALEHRLGTLAGPDAAGYARRLRERRFGGADEPCPGRAERRRLRNALADAAGAGRLARLRLALPDVPFDRRR